ncbi:MAG: hypothetical protein ABI780_10030 [Ardenticatenales bacterium]
MKNPTAAVATALTIAIVIGVIVMMEGQVAMLPNGIHSGGETVGQQMHTDDQRSAVMQSSPTDTPMSLFHFTNVHVEGVSPSSVGIIAPIAIEGRIAQALSPRFNTMSGAPPTASHLSNHWEVSDASAKYYTFVIDVTNDYRGASGLHGFVVAISTLLGGVEIDQKHLEVGDHVIGFMSPMPEPPFTGVLAPQSQFTHDKAGELSAGGVVYDDAGIGALYRLEGDAAYEVISGVEYPLSAVMEYTQ